MNRIRVLTILLSAVLLVGGLVAPPATAGPVWLTSNVSWTNADLTLSPPTAPGGPTSATVTTSASTGW